VLQVFVVDDHPADGDGAPSDSAADKEVRGVEVAHTSTCVMMAIAVTIRWNYNMLFRLEASTFMA
jgi:hypothetical protein